MVKVGNCNFVLTINNEMKNICFTLINIWKGFNNNNDLSLLNDEDIFNICNYKPIQYKR